MLLATAATCFAGPKVVPHSRTNAVNVSDGSSNLISTFDAPKDIKLLQDIFLRSTRVGSTKTHLKASTHKIDFSDRWLVDINTGEIGVLSKTVSDVYQLDESDLLTLRELIKEHNKSMDANP